MKVKHIQYRLYTIPHSNRTVSKIESTTIYSTVLFHQNTEADGIDVVGRQPLAIFIQSSTNDVRRPRRVRKIHTKIKVRFLSAVQHNE